VKGELDGDVTGYRKRITPREDRRTRSAATAIESGARKGQRGESERVGERQQISLQARKLAQWP